MLGKEINLEFQSSSGHGSNAIIKIGINETVREAEHKFCEKIGVSNSRVKDMKFIYKNKELIPDMKISQSGLKNSSKILVIELYNIIGA